MKMYSIRFGFTGSASVMAESKEKAFELLEPYGDSKMTIDSIDEYDENEVDVNYADE